MNSIHQVFFGLLRLAVSGTPYEVSPMTDEGWAVLYRMAHQQSLKGLLYAAVSQLPTGQHPPMELAMQWISEAEANRGMNDLQNHEAARLTKLFGDAGRRTAILKGQANARLYPDKLSRQPGDIDIWVEGGRESVIDLLISMGLLDEKPTISNAGKREKATTSYHHAHLPATKDGIAVEVHYRPSSGNFNPWTNRPLQAWLERQQQGMWRRVFAGKWRHLRQMRFNFWEVFWLEANYWKTIVQTLPERIRRRSFSLGEADKRDTKRHGNKIL